MITRLLLAMDRGKNIRTQGGYRELIDPYFADVEMWLVKDLLWLPYSHFIVRATSDSRI